MNVARHARRLAAPVGRPLRRAAVGLRTRGWAPHSHLFVEQEAAEWVLSYEARQLARVATSLGIELGPRGWARGVANQSIFYLSQFTLLLHDFERAGNNIGFAYFHGRPGTPGMPEFDACFETMRTRHAEIDRIQVTNREMAALVLSTGIGEEKVHRIPIGIDVDAFRPRDDESRLAARARFGLPDSAFVLGSFQKDGVGWGDGLEPKLIKGPDVLLAVAERVAEQVPELHVLLTGPARGYVRAGLERLGIPYRHALLPDVDAVRPGLSRDRRLPRRVARRGRPASGARVDGDARPARDDEGRAGRRPRAPRRERLDGRAGGRRRARRLDAARRRRRAEATSSLSSPRGGRPRRRTPTTPCSPRWRALLDGFVALRGRVMDASAARVGRYGRARPRVGRGSSRAVAHDRGCASSTAGI